MSRPWGLKYPIEEFKRKLEEEGVNATAEYFGISRERVAARMYYHGIMAKDYKPGASLKREQRKVRRYPVAAGPPKAYEGCPNFKVKKCFNGRQCYNRECPLHPGGNGSAHRGRGNKNPF